MIAAPNPAQSESFKPSLPIKSLVERLNIDPADLREDRSPSGRPSPRERFPLILARFLIPFSIGVAATVALQSYGHATREMLASAVPLLRWLAPQAGPSAQNLAVVTAPPAPLAPSPDGQQPNAMSPDLDMVRQSADKIAAGQEQMTHSLERIATSQERMARTVDELGAGREQLTREITKLQAIEQYILYKNSEPPAPKTVQRPSQGRAVR
jgi:hypothetical protein